MQFSLSFVAFVLLSTVAALPQDTAIQTIAPGATPPKDTIYYIPTPAHVVADRNARNAHRQLHHLGLGNNDCIQSDGGGSFCTQMACYNTACVDICGPFDDSAACGDAGNGLLDVAHSCQYGAGVTGGWCDGPTNPNYGALSFGYYHS
ncbi:hypothetical protein B0H16DRAFT_1687026 [Mycena metata]|uniref:Uncharacterized protein n=1 Tax=Mycena metata TaxID=1033252 RepID=A0AAD7NM60_9AGAR|nr:hypothetical protein B0H16DRAFT_1687026 [Mycena metata]